MLAHKGGAGAVSYAASKAGLLGLTRSLAVEAANSLRGGMVVRSNAIVPGYIDTPMIAGEFILLSCFRSPEEVLATIDKLEN